MTIISKIKLLMWFAISLVICFEKTANALTADGLTHERGSMQMWQCYDEEIAMSYKAELTNEENEIYNKVKRDLGEDTLDILTNQTDNTVIGEILEASSLSSEEIIILGRAILKRQYRDVKNDLEHLCNRIEESDTHFGWTSMREFHQDAREMGEYNNLVNGRKNLHALGEKIAKIPVSENANR